MNINTNVGSKQRHCCLADPLAMSFFLPTLLHCTSPSYLYAQCRTRDSALSQRTITTGARGKVSLFPSSEDPVISVIYSWRHQDLQFLKPRIECCTSGRGAPNPGIIKSVNLFSYLCPLNKNKHQTLIVWEQLHCMG